MGDGHEPLDKLARMPPASTAASFTGTKDLQTATFLRGRYLSSRSITYPPRAEMRLAIDRENYLQISSLSAVRAMRAILCGVQSRQAVLGPQEDFCWPSAERSRTQG